MISNRIFNNVLLSGFLAVLATVAWAQKPVPAAKTFRAISQPVGTQLPNQLLAQTRLFMQQHHGKLPRTSISLGKGPASIYDLNPQQQWEVRLARQAYYQITKNPQPQDNSWRQLKQLYEGKEGKLPTPTPEEFLPLLQAWVQAHNGFRPRLNIYENGHHLSVGELRRKDIEEGSQLYQEYTLARQFDLIMKRGVADKQTREALAAIEDLPTVTHWQTPKDHQFYDGFGNALPSQYTLLKQLQAWSAAHGHTKPRVLFHQNGKRLSVKELAQFPSLYEEYQLGYRLRHVLYKKGQTSDLQKQFLRIQELPMYRPEK